MDAGAAGVVLKSGAQNFILTCSHVAFGGKATDAGGRVSSSHANVRTRVLKGNIQRELGKLYYATCSSAGDFALVEVTGNYFNVLPNGQRIKTTAVDPSRLSSGEEVYFFSARRNALIKATLQSPKNPNSESFEYSDGKTITYTNLITFGVKQGNGHWKTVSAKGDSGSLVFTKNLEPIGILIGGNNDFSFAIPLNTILTKTQTQIK